MSVELSQQEQAILDRIQDPKLKEETRQALLSAKQTAVAKVTTFGLSISETVQKRMKDGSTKVFPGSGIGKVAGYGRRPILVHLPALLDIVENHAEEVKVFCRANMARAAQLRKAYKPIGDEE